MNPVAHADSSPLPSVPQPVLDDLARVETRLAEELQSREPRLTEITAHLVDAGGKRVRPMVVSLVAHAASGGTLARRDDVIEAAVALELIHSATLLHDDIIDGGETRRGKPSALAVFGLGDTLVAGDFLFCRAFALCARFEASVIRWAAEACVALTEGEILQARFRRNPAVTVDDYLEIIDRKTASLFATGARTAAHLAGAPASVVAAMQACGTQVGRAFQMQDDLLDVEGSTARTGKPRGLDLRDGNPSLPIVLALAHDAEVRRIFGLPQPTPADIEAGLARIRRSGVCRSVADRARDALGDALGAVTALPPSDYRTALEGLAHGLGDRTT
ncbi:MAG TPA: polyprenyl synthetase family protein [Candidatus Eisenbacteria bacterium]|nr:polyprenyl synthetase family protein [Candidatus Eisenbacteria bacterium]